MLNEQAEQSRSLQATAIAAAQRHVLQPPAGPAQQYPQEVRARAYQTPVPASAPVQQQQPTTQHYYIGEVPQQPTTQHYYIGEGPETHPRVPPPPKAPPAHLVAMQGSVTQATLPEHVRQARGTVSRPQAASSAPATGQASSSSSTQAQPQQRQTQASGSSGAPSVVAGGRGAAVPRQARSDLQPAQMVAPHQCASAYGQPAPIQRPTVEQAGRDAFLYTTQLKSPYATRRDVDMNKLLKDRLSEADFAKFGISKRKR